MTEAHLYDRNPDNSCTCRLCSRKCRIPDGRCGVCGVRYNIRGTLKAESYSRISAVNVDPVEKKPLYHFMPASKVYSLGGAGCNFKCRHCQNWEISASPDAASYTMSPDKAVMNALASHAHSIAFTYNEPAIWHEYALDICRKAHENGLKTIYVTNGYLTEDALDELKGYADAYRVDIKAFTEEFYRNVCQAHLQPVLDSAVHAYDCGMHVEVVNLIIPGYNDNPDELKRLSEWIYANLGEDTPVHFTRFHPDYMMTDIPPTPLHTLEDAWNTAKNAGLNYVYLGNVPDTEKTNTYCPDCGALLIERNGYRTEIKGLNGAVCRNCGKKIPIVL